MLADDIYVAECDGLSPAILAFLIADQRPTICASTQVGEVHLLRHHL